MNNRGSPRPTYTLLLYTTPYHGWGRHTNATDLYKEPPYKSHDIAAGAQVPLQD